MLYDRLRILFHFQARSDDFLLETFSGDEEETLDANTGLKAELAVDASAEIQDLLHRKLELEEKNRKQELHQQRVMVRV